MIYETKMILYNSYFDVNDKISPKSILNIFQDVASYHAGEIGVGYEDMLAKNLYWVLSRIKYDIIRMPKIDEQVIVQTWPHEKGRSDFGLLQQNIKAGQGDFYYVVFDVLAFNGKDFRKEPLRRRKEFLNKILINSPSNLIESSFVIGNGKNVLKLLKT